MERQYSVTLRGQSAGKVSVTRRGLYYHFHCRCELPAEDICRLIVSSGTAQESLGVLVPLDGGFGLDTKLPVKQLGEGELIFCVVPKQITPSRSFVPILDEEPFAYIAHLKESFLVHKKGHAGISVEKMQEF